MSPPHPISQPHNPVSYRLYHVGGEVGAGLGGFDALLLNKEELIVRSRSGCTRERPLFLRVFKFFDSPAQPGRPSSSAMASSGAVQAVFISSSPWYETVSYLSTHGYPPKKQTAAALLWQKGIQTAESCSCLCPGVKNPSCS